MPGRIVRWPNFAVFAATASVAAVPGTTAAIVHSENPLVLFRAPTGLAVGLARKESRYGHPPAAQQSVPADSPPGRSSPMAWPGPLVPPLPGRQAAEDSAMGVRRGGI